MSSVPRGDMVGLRNVYDDLATALGSAHHQATLANASPDQLAAVNQAVQQLWSLTVQRLGAGLERADLSDLPPVVEPDLQAQADLDVDAILDHVAAFEPAATVTPMTSGGRFDGLRAQAEITADRARSHMRSIGAPGSGHEPGRGEEIKAWVTEALSRIPMPDAPVHEPWVLAPSALIASHLPRPLARAPGLLDRFGAIRLAPHEIGIDTARPVPWKDVVELRTLPLLDVLTIGTSGNLAALGARLLPVPRLADGLLRVGAEKAAEAVRSLLLIAAAEHAERAASVQIPAGIVYRASWRGHKTITAGLFSSAVLALPRLTDSVLATARQHAVPITALGTGQRRSPQDPTAHVRYQRAALTRRLP